MSTYSAEEEEDNDDEASDPADHGTPKDASGRSYAGVARFFGDVARRIEANEDTGRRKVREAPVPARRGAGAIVGGHEGIVGRAETDGLGGADGKPNHVEDKVEEDRAGREIEDPFKIFCC